MKRWLLALRLLLALMFIYSAYTKLKDPWTMFAMSIDAYQVLPEWAVLTVARVLPWFELLLGVMLAGGWLLRYVAAAATGLMGAFFGLMLHAYLQGLHIDCGCFGPGEALGVKTLLRDGGLLLALGFLTTTAIRGRARAQSLA